MEVSAEILNWLQRADDTIEANYITGNYYELSPEWSSALENGAGFAPILTLVVKGLNEREVYNTLRDANSPAVRLGNWNFISKAIKQIGVDIDADTKALIVAGDSDVVLDILLQVHRASQNSRPTPSPRPQAKSGAPATIQLEEIYAEKDYTETTSCLELMLVSFMKHFGVDSK